MSPVSLCVTTRSLSTSSSISTFISPKIKSKSLVSFLIYNNYYIPWRIPPTKNRFIWIKKYILTFKLEVIQGIMEYGFKLTSVLCADNCNIHHLSMVLIFSSFHLALKSYFRDPNQTKIFPLPDYSIMSSSPLTKVFPFISLMAASAA